MPATRQIRTLAVKVTLILNPNPHPHRRHEAKLRFGNVTDLTKALIPAAIMTAMSASDLPALFRSILQQPMFQRRGQLVRDNMAALEGTSLRASISWHEHDMMQA